MLWWELKKEIRQWKISIYLYVHIVSITRQKLMVYAWSKTSVSKFGIFLEKGNSNLKNQIVLSCIWFSSPKIVWQSITKQLNQA